jgi:hypothetical protein
MQEGVTFAQVEPPMPTGDEEDDEWQAWQRKTIMELPSLVKPITVSAETKCSEAVRIMKDAGIDQVCAGPEDIHES